MSIDRKELMYQCKRHFDLHTEENFTTFGQLLRTAHNNLTFTEIHGIHWGLAEYSDHCDKRIEQLEAALKDTILALSDAEMVSERDDGTWYWRTTGESVLEEDR